MPASSPSSMKNMDAKMPIIIGVVIVIIVAIGLLTMKKGNAPVINRQATESVLSVQELVQKVSSKGVPVKENEIPVVAQIKDVGSLQAANSVFYKDAQNGDLIYIWSDRVALYSTSQDKVLQLVALIPEAGQTVTPQTVPIVLTPGASLEAEAAIVEVRNGSSRAGLGKTASEKLKQAKVNALPATDAVKTETKTFIMPTKLDKALGNTLKTIRDVTGGELVSPNPAYGPFKGDVLVMIGTDYK